MLPDITDQPWHTALYPYLAPDAPQNIVECQMCGDDMTEGEVLRNEWYCDKCRAEMEDMEVEDV